MNGIRHVVHLMLENRSFDQMLGICQSFDGRIEGIDPTDPRSNTDILDREYEQEPGPDPEVDPDPKHETRNVLSQMRGGMQNFAFDYSQYHDEAKPKQIRNVMAYYALDTLAALHPLARHFVVCDHWFCSVPGPTWTNRLFALSGTSQGRVKMPEPPLHLNLHKYDQDTIFERFRAEKLSTRVYYGDFPLSLLLAHQRRAVSLRDYRPLEQFAADAKGPADEFPSYVFVEPDYLGDDEANDDHPPHDPRRSQILVAKLYVALRSNEELWNSTLLVINYDEHGGFYDHVPPPPTIAPDARTDEYTFDRLGPRVPALLVSPLLDRDVIQDECDHTSLLHVLIEQFGLGKKGLGKRERQSSALHKALESRLRQAPRPASELAELDAGMKKLAGRKTKPKKKKKKAKERPPNDHENALLGLSEALELRLRREALKQQGLAPAAAETLPERKLAARRGAARATAKRMLK